MAFTRWAPTPRGRPGYVGILTAHLAAGGDSDGAGFLTGFGVEHSGQRFSAFAQTQYASRSFVQTGMAELQYTPRQRTFGGLGFNFGAYGNAQVAYGLQSFYDSETVETVGINYSVALGRLGYLGLYASHTSATDSETNVLLTWTLSLGDRRTLSTSLQQSSAPSDFGGGFQGNVTLQRDLPAGSGLGYRMSLSSSDEQDAYLAYQGRAGTASVDYARRNGDSGVRVGATGGLAITGAGVMPARQLNESFAVVQVADYPGLTVYVGQPAGGSHGRARSRADRSTAPVRTQRDQRRSDAGADGRQPVAVGDRRDTGLSQRRAGALPGRTRHGRDDAGRAGRTARRCPAGASATSRRGTISRLRSTGCCTWKACAKRLACASSWHGGQCSFEARRPAGTDPVPDLGDVPMQIARASPDGFDSTALARRRARLTAALALLLCAVVGHGARGGGLLDHGRQRQFRRVRPRRDVARRLGRHGHRHVPARLRRRRAHQLHGDALERHERHQCRDAPDGRRHGAPRLQRLHGPGSHAGLGQRHGRHRDCVGRDDRRPWRRQRHANGHAHASTAASRNCRTRCRAPTPTRWC